MDQRETTVRQAAIKIQESQAAIAAEVTQGRVGDAKGLWTELTGVCTHYSLGLATLGHWEEIEGIRRIALTTFNDVTSRVTTLDGITLCVVPHLPWLAPLSLHAQGKYEAAVALYQRTLTHLLHSTKHDGSVYPRCTRHHFAFICDRIVECHVSLGDWAGLTKWLRDLQRIRKVPHESDKKGDKSSQIPDLAVLQSLGVSVSPDVTRFVTSLASFDEGVYLSPLPDDGGVSSSLSGHQTVVSLFHHAMCQQVNARDSSDTLASLRKWIVSEYVEKVGEREQHAMSLLPCVTLLEEWTPRQDIPRPSASEMIMDHFHRSARKDTAYSHVYLSVLLRVCRHLTRVCDDRKEYFGRLYSAVAIAAAREEARKHNFQFSYSLLSSADVIRYTPSPQLAIHRAKIHWKESQHLMAFSFLCDTAHSALDSLPPSLPSSLLPLTLPLSESTLASETTAILGRVYEQLGSWILKTPDRMNIVFFLHLSF